MDCLFINVYKDSVGCYHVDIETLIILSVYKVTGNKNVQLIIRFQLEVPVEPTVVINLSDVKFVPSINISEITSYCIWPMVVNEKNITAGLCSVARLLIRKSDRPNVRDLLGFREACLLAHSESSIWTRFCEVDIISATKRLLCNECYNNNKFYLPEDIARFEFHLSQPVRTHNIYKMAREKNKDKTIHSNIPIKELNLAHLYGEGTTMTLADIILYPCYTILFSKCPIELLQDKIPLTVKWFKQMEPYSLPGIFTPSKIETSINEIIEPLFSKYSLYTADPTRYKPEKRIFTKQSDIDLALKAVNSLEHEIINSFLPFGYDTTFDWSEIPLEANPSGGALPEKRVKRKQEQLENLVKAVVKIAGDKRRKIVDFCSGSGHLGILLALLLPNCEVILVENKEHSLIRARERVTKLKLKNVVTVQSNLDYFHGNFDIGVTLHACGVASDLVIQNCIKNNASFVVCPCCYGGVKNCYHLKYPRSNQFQTISLDYKSYLCLAHAADQTHDVDNVKTKQGYLCMDIVDTDRKLFAESCDYEVYLGKLQPTGCTNKNNLLVGLYKKK